MFSQDFKELLSAFNEHRVKYLVVGGYAVAVHAQPRATKDLDLFIQPDPENAKAVFAALARFGAPLAGVKPADFIDPDSFFRIGAAPQMIEILPRISGVNFDQAWKRRRSHRLEGVLHIGRRFCCKQIGCCQSSGYCRCCGRSARHRAEVAFEAGRTSRPERQRLTILTFQRIRAYSFSG
jgi:hypothetical protein